MVFKIIHIFKEYTQIQNTLVYVSKDGEGVKFVFRTVIDDSDKVLSVCQNSISRTLSREVFRSLIFLTQTIFFQFF